MVQGCSKVCGTDEERLESSYLGQYASGTGIMMPPGLGKVDQASQAGVAGLNEKEAKEKEVGKDKVV